MGSIVPKSEVTCVILRVKSWNKRNLGAARRTRMMNTAAMRKLWYVVALVAAHGSLAVAGLVMPAADMLGRWRCGVERGAADV